MPRRLRILWVTPFLPRPGVAAARGYWWALLNRLAPRHDVTLLTLVHPDDAGTDDALPASLKAVHRLAARGWEPDDPLALLPQTVAGLTSDPAYAAALAERVAAEPFDLVQLELVETARLAPVPSSVPTILAVHQLGFAQERARWHAEGGSLLRGAIHAHRWLRALDFELRAVERAHHVLTVTPEDAVRLRRFFPALRVSVSPVGVDTAAFRPVEPAPPPDTDLLFVGHFGHPPNVDAVRFLARDVLPLLPGVRARIVGHACPPDLAAEARAAGADVAGSVADVRPALAAARVVVAPVRFGTGMRGKVLEALAMRRPVVTTPLGAEGLGATPGRHLLVAERPGDFAAAIRRVLDDPSLAARLGAEGRTLVAARFGWDAIADAHERLWEEVARAPGRPPAPRPDRSAAVARAVRGFGRWPAIGAGTGILATRALRWHLARGVHGAVGVDARLAADGLGS
jgi:glycosyltransferase involved in cell wall biosynthesis